MASPFALVAAALWIAGTGVYVRGITKKKFEFQFVTWLIWTVVPLVTGTVQWWGGVGLTQTIFTVMTGACPGIVLIYGIWRGQTCMPRGWDQLPLWVAAGTLCFRVIGGDSWLSVLLLVVGDALGALPTFASSWRAPTKESLGCYLLYMLSGYANLFTIEHCRLADFAEWGFGVYIALLYTALSALILYRRANLATANLHLGRAAA